MNFSRALPRGRSRRTFARAAAVGLVLAGTAAVAGQALAVPTVPNNIVVFPQRDFVTIEGY
ncbi:MAG TPA: hypothetical protein VFU85_02070, partial [Nocardioides sp.]|nr:hypothetical protein [Nocardioides sp.]